MSCLVVQVFIYACGGFGNRKNSWKFNKGCQKHWSFYSKHVFPTNRLQFPKESFIFPCVTGNILEEGVDLIVTEDRADHFASYEIIECSK